MIKASTIQSICDPPLKIATTFITSRLKTAFDYRYVFLGISLSWMIVSATRRYNLCAMTRGQLSSHIRL